MNRVWLNHSNVGYNASFNRCTGQQNVFIGQNAGYDTDTGKLVGNSGLKSVALRYGEELAPDSVTTIAKNKVNLAASAVRFAAESIK